MCRKIFSCNYLSLLIIIGAVTSNSNVAADYSYETLPNILIILTDDQDLILNGMVI